MYNRSRWIGKGFEAWLPEGLRADDRKLHKPWRGRDPAGRCRGGGGGGGRAVREHRGAVRWIPARGFPAEVGPARG